MRLAALLLLVATAASAQSTNPAVTQASIDRTVCVRGWTATVRPTWAESSRIKHQLCLAHGMRRCAPGLILDHIIPLEAGGAPRDPANLQLQTIGESLAKDALEYEAHRDLCRHRATLAQVQSRFSRTRP